jgi:hypothetical protein
VTSGNCEREGERRAQADRGHDEGRSEARFLREPGPRNHMPGHDAGGDLAASDPPIVRTMVLMPVATPVWRWSTASTTRLAIEAKEKPIPRPSIAVPT